jgi:hypothetical protein
LRQRAEAAERTRDGYKGDCEYLREEAATADRAKTKAAFAEIGYTAKLQNERDEARAVANTNKQEYTIAFDRVQNVERMLDEARAALSREQAAAGAMREAFSTKSTEAYRQAIIMKCAQGQNAWEERAAAALCSDAGRLAEEVIAKARTIGHTCGSHTHLQCGACVVAAPLAALDGRKGQP